MNFLAQHAYPAQGVTLCTYLIALAAVQKGLKVSFIDNLAKEGYLKHCDGLSATVLEISDGDKTYCFDRSRGSLTAYAAVSVAVNKWKAKEVLLKSGVSTPWGTVVEDKKVASSPGYFDSLGFKKVVVKPVSGTQGRGVVTGIKSQEQLERLLNEYSYEKFLIEEEVSGKEYRYYVADGRVVAVAGRDPANVIGNGKSTIRALIKEKNKERQRNPHLASRLIKLGIIARNYLAENGMSPEYVPPAGEKVYISPSANFSTGGDSLDATDLVSDSSKLVAIQAAEALGLPNTGVDIINVDDNGDEKSYVIEVNARAQIGSHSFPMVGAGQDNLVAEAIIDAYFPEKKGFCARGVFFDFQSIKDIISDGQVSRVTLPVIEQTFIKRKIEVLSDEVDLSKKAEAIKKKMIKERCYGDVSVYSNGVCHLSMLGSKESISAVKSFVSDAIKKGGDVSVKAMKAAIELKFEVRDFSKIEECQLPFKAKYIFSGVVQNVGFRKWLRSRAIDMNITGWVRNRSDGSVEAVLSSQEKANIIRLVDLCKEGPKGAVVNGIEELKTTERNLSGFRIRRLR
ncbi:MAG: acylphosphatase [Halomonas sp.]|nr:acylphosphatase [Halomonas sp.]MCC5903053.1 acylphosphatase [Halomonas sp.]